MNFNNRHLLFNQSNARSHHVIGQHRRKTSVLRQGIPARTISSPAITNKTTLKEKPTVQLTGQSYHVVSQEVMSLVLRTPAMPSSPQLFFLFSDFAHTAMNNYMRLYLLGSIREKKKPRLSGLYYVPDHLVVQTPQSPESSPALCYDRSGRSYCLGYIYNRSKKIESEERGGKKLEEKKRKE